MKRFKLISLKCKPEDNSNYEWQTAASYRFLNVYLELFLFMCLCTLAMFHFFGLIIPDEIAGLFA